MKEIEVNRDYYNQNAEQWSANKTDSFFHEEGFRKLISDLKEGDSVIDIGCAYGIHVPLFLGIGRHLVYEGFDISEKMIDIAESRYPQLNFKVANILDKETLPKKKFNAFWAGAVLMHIPEKSWNEMLENIEMLVPGGIGYFTMPTMRPNEESDTDHRHFSLFDENKLSNFLESRGWKILEQGGFDKPNKAIWRWYLVRLP